MTLISSFRAKVHRICNKLEYQVFMHLDCDNKMYKYLLVLILVIWLVMMKVTGLSFHTALVG